jgi:hypothetical protein
MLKEEMSNTPPCQLFLLVIPRNQKVPKLFKLTTLCNTGINAET